MFVCDFFFIAISNMYNDHNVRVHRQFVRSGRCHTIFFSNKLVRDVFFHFRSLIQEANQDALSILSFDRTRWLDTISILRCYACNTRTTLTVGHFDSHFSSSSSFFPNFLIHLCDWVNWKIRSFRLSATTWESMWVFRLSMVSTLIELRLNSQTMAIVHCFKSNISIE